MVTLSELRIHHRSRKMIVSVAILLLIVSVTALTPITASGGTLQLSLQGYGTVSGELRNAIIQPNNSVSMIMFVNDKIQTSNGPVQLTSNGTWTGVRNGSFLSGPIKGIVGRAQFCILICVSADFVGQGHWIGTMIGSRGSGTFDGTITFANSPVPQIQNGQPYLISGTWNADFNIPVPEFGQSLPIYNVLVFTVVSLLLVVNRRLSSSARSDNLSE
jgi:hypothetical protein